MHSRNTAEVGARGGTWGGSADFATLVPPYVFAFQMTMVVRLVGLAPLRFGTRGGRWGGSLGAGAGEQRQGMVEAAVEGVPWGYQGDIGHYIW